MAERSMAAGCKPAAPCELRGFESSPVHQETSGKWLVASGKNIIRGMGFGHERQLCSTHGAWPLSCHWPLFLRGGSNSVVESQPSKLLVAGSIPVSRSKNTMVSGKWPVTGAKRGDGVKLLSTCH